MFLSIILSINLSLIYIFYTPEVGASTCVSSFSPRDAAFLFEQGLVGREKKFIPELLVERYGKTIADKNSGDQAWLFNLELDVLDILKVAPELRAGNYQHLATKYGIATDKAEYIVLYYARLFYDDIRIAGDPKDVFPKLRALNREHVLGDASPQMTQRYMFYLMNITILSVPEIADKLNISEPMVYQDLMDFGISIEDEFAIALKWHRPTGEQALNFYQHYMNEKNRGVKWNRELIYEDVARSEEDLLEYLYVEKNIRNSQALAKVLNELAGTTDLDDPDIRTAASVTAKLRHLNLTVRVKRENPDLEIPGFGEVKRGGMLQENALAYIDAHYFLSDEQLAEMLGVELSTLKAFIKRNFDVRGGKAGMRVLKGKGKTESTGLLLGYEEQRGSAAAGRELSVWMAKNPDNVPKRPLRNGHEINAKNMTPEEADEMHAYQKMMKYAATDEEARNTEAKAKFMSHLTPEQRELVVAWHQRRSDPIEAGGKQLSAWMSQNPDKVPKKPLRNGRPIKASDLTVENADELSIYNKMLKYAATDEEGQNDEAKAKFMSQLTQHQRDLVVAWQLRRTNPFEAAGKELNAWMTKFPGNIPKSPSKDGRPIKASDMTPEDAEELSIYYKMLKYVATDAETQIDEAKVKFMSQLTQQQREAVIAWHLTRTKPIETAGRELNAWLNKNPGKVPKQPRWKNGRKVKASEMTPEETNELSIYNKMLKYTATDEEAQNDENKAKFMAQLTPEQRELVHAWHKSRRQ